MDATRKIPNEDIKLLDEIQMGLKKRDIKITQKELIDKAIKFSLRDNREDFIKMIRAKKMNKRIDERKMWEEFLNNGVEIEGDILKEHDTIL